MDVCCICWCGALVGFVLYIRRNWFSGVGFSGFGVLFVGFTLSGFVRDKTVFELVRLGFPYGCD